MSYQYTYLIGDLIFLFFWAILFLWRKDVRKEMLSLSVIFGIIGLLIEPIYIRDWWKPLTITGTSIGIEDFLFGFAIAGIAAVIYEEIFKKKVKVRKVNKIKEKQRNISLFYIILSMAISFAIFFFALKLNTLISSIVTFLVPILIIYTKRKDLIVDSLTTGGILTVISILGYSIINLISPGFIEQFWLFENIGKILILGVPLEEIIWSLLAGALMGPLYEYWKQGKLINKK